MLVRGITGFRDSSDPPLSSTDRRAFLAALHTAAREVHAVIRSERGRDPVANFLEMEVTTPDGDELTVLVNDHEPLVAFSPGSPAPTRFVSYPELALALEAADAQFRVLEPAELNRSVTDSDLTHLGEAELDQVAYWKPQTLGEVIFNRWD